MIRVRTTVCILICILIALVLALLAIDSHLFNISINFSSNTDVTEQSDLSHINEYCLSSKICQTVFGVDPKTFCATKGDNTLLENAYIEATVTSDDVLVLQLTDAQMNSWKNAVVHLQILQSILGEDKEIVSKVIPPADPFYKSLYEDAVNCGFEISDDYSKVVAGPGDDKSYKLIVPHACLMMQIFEGKPSSEISVEYLEVNTKGDVIEQISFPVYMYVFKDLNECKSLMSYEKIPSEIIEYHTPEIDANYHSMEYNDFWGMRYKSNDIEYEIFAYDFASKDDALRYYIKSTGEAQLADKNSHGVKHIGQGEYQVIVIEGTKVYRLISSNMLVDKIDKMLAVVFSGRI